MSDANIPLSLYIHVPWCLKKCPYCDFNSHVSHTTIDEDNYCQTLIHELQYQLRLHENLVERPIRSIFIGGGTPSLFSGQAYAELFKQLRHYLTLSHSIEITLEANPGTVDESHFYDYYAAGINRLSLGVQSWQDHLLKKLGRIHSSTDAKNALQIARKAGFTNVNIDIMHGLPGQDLPQALDDLQTTLDQAPTHISWYQLTLEPNTYFHRYPPAKLPDSDQLADLWQQGQQLLAEHDFEQYEVSAYAKQQAYCQHNLNYWQFGDYLGLGAGAHSKLTNNNGSVTRHWNVKNPRDYLANTHFMANQQTLLNTQLPFEFMLNALRLYQTIPLELFYQRTGLNFTHIDVPLKKATQLGLLRYDDKQITVSQRGRYLLNDLLELFL